MSSPENAGASYASPYVRKFSGINEDTSLPLNEKVEMVVVEVEKGLITQALEEVGWKREKAASLLGISLKTLYNKMNKYGLLDQSP